MSRQLSKMREELVRDWQGGMCEREESGMICEVLAGTAI